MRVDSQPHADVQNNAKDASEAVRHSGKDKQAVKGTVLSEQSIANFNRSLLTNKESEEPAIATESLGVEFDADRECCLWPDLQLFKSTREF